MEYTVTLHPYGGDGVAFFLFGILVLAIIIGKSLWEKQILWEKLVKPMLTNQNSE